MKSEKEKMTAGELYLASDPELCADRARARTLLRRLNNSLELDPAEWREILTELLPNASRDIYIEPPFFVDYGYNVFCGEHVYFNANCLILDSAEVRIGSHTLIGPSVQLYTATHPLEAMARRTTEFAKPISIGNDCWIGGGTIICPGVAIGDRCVVAAGSVVTKNIPPDSFVAGTPAVVKRTLEN